MDIFDFDGGYVESYGDGSDEVRDVADLPTLQGDGNSPPVQADTTPQRSNSLLELLGSVGKTAKELGTALGKTQRDVMSADNEFKKARDAQLKGNSVSTWWQYTSTTDKVMIGLAAAGVALVLWKGK